MDFSSTLTQYTAVLSLAALLAGLYLLSQPTTGLVKWLQKKNYQYEVTFSLYMLTPTEKFVFNSILFLTISMFLLASIVYLPNHIATISRRTYYYFAGDAALMTSSRHAAETLYGSATRAGDKVLDAAAGWAQTAYQAALNRSVTAAAVASRVPDVVGGAAAAGEVVGGVGGGN